MGGMRYESRGCAGGEAQYVTRHYLALERSLSGVDLSDVAVEMVGPEREVVRTVL